MIQSRPLYLFPHLPKTGGAALFQNVERFLPVSRCLRLNCTHRQYYVDPRTRKLHFYESEEDFKNLMKSLSESEKSQIQFASGHDLAYGFHEYFPQPARYFMFVREPIARTISLYNYQRTQHEFLNKMKKMDESHRRLRLFSQRWFLREGKVPSFEEWLEESYNHDYPFYFTMTRTLQHLHYLDVEIKEDSWGKLLQKFFFVGLTETLNEDELYLYHEMGVRCFWANRNASYPYISHNQLEKRLQEKIREKNPDDFLLYERAKRANSSFKKKQKDFPIIVKQMEMKKKGYFLIEKGGPLIKFFLRPLLPKSLRKRIKKYFINQ